MLDPQKLLNDLLGTQVPGTQGTIRDKASQAGQLARDNPLATGALAAVLLGTKGGRQLTGSALKLGGLAAVAGLAYRAYQNYQSGNAPAEGGGSAPQIELEPAPAQSEFDPSTAPQGEEAFALVIARAMIAAARADGHINAEERQRIAQQLKAVGMNGDNERFLVEELERPVDIDTLVAEARTEAQKVELYTASRLAIDPETRAERGYLDLLAGRLGLPDALIDQVEATVDGAKEVH